MKLKILILSLIIGGIAFAVFSANKPARFAPADDFPREGALVYVQVEDLPAFIKLWNESSFKEKYAQSENFKDFQNRHLGRKLASRWREFSDAAGFPLDLETVAGLAQNKAALAVYDIGKLEFVFIAPVSNEVFAATKFATVEDNFAEQTLDDGTIIYRVKVEADRGRQNQELIFCYSNGRFVLTTSEKLMARALQNINGANSKNRLSDAPLFAALKDKIEPHLASIWVNQTALNDDYYFKRYWLMPENEKLKNIRAGIFDLQIEEDKIIENRKFLVDKSSQSHAINRNEAASLLALLPENIQFYRLESANETTIDEALQKTIFERRKLNKKSKNSFASGEFFDDYDYNSSNYEYLNGKYDETIDDAGDENETSENTAAVENTSLSDILRPAQPQSVLTFADSRISPAPMFLELKRAAVFYLAAPKNFNRELFETQIAQKFAAQTMIAAPGVNLKWETKNETNLTERRQLSLPMLGISVCYAVRGNKLILTNSSDFLDKIFAAPSAPAQSSNEEFNSLSVINLLEKDRAYNKVFAALAEKQATNDFFSQNVKSFINSISDLKKIEIKINQKENITEETLIGYR